MTAVQVSGATQAGVPVAYRAANSLGGAGKSSTRHMRADVPCGVEPTHPCPSQRDIPEAATALILLGLDDMGRPHASRFTVYEEERVRAAAEAMQFAVLPVTGDAMTELVSKLPIGKVFASGKAFVPFAKQDLFDRLAAYLPIKARPVKRAAVAAKAKTGEANAADSAAPNQSDKDSAATASANAYAAVRDGAKFKPNVLPGGFDQIKVGSVVLASEYRDDGWWTAVVIENKGDGLWLLKWEDFEDIEPFLRRPEQMALLHPAYKGE